MLKKSFIGAVVFTVLGSLAFGREAWSYVSTSITSVRQAIKQEIPLEFDVKRARNMIADLEAEVRQSLHSIAEEEVNIQELQQELDAQTVLHERQKEQILSQRKDLETKQTTYKYGGKIYTVSEVQRDLADRFARYQTVEETLEKRRQILSSRKSSLITAKKRLDEMLDAKEHLLVEIENLDVKLKTLKATEAASTFEISDSVLSRAKTLVKAINKKADIKQRMIDGAGNPTGLIPLDEVSEPESDVTAQIDRFFKVGEVGEALTDSHPKSEAKAISTVN